MVNKQKGIEKWSSGLGDKEDKKGWMGEGFSSMLNSIRTLLVLV